MPYPTKAEFVELLRTRNHPEIVDEILLAGTPYVFASSPETYNLLRTRLSGELRAQVEDISVVGSGRIGFSLSPDKFGKPYAPATSDIDTVVVNAALFDAAWYQMCSKGRSVLSLDFRAREALKQHRTSNVFNGYIEPNRLAGVITLSPLWFRSFAGLARVPELAALDIQGRLYRTWEHVRFQQLYSLNAVSSMLEL